MFDEHDAAGNDRQHDLAEDAGGLLGERRNRVEMISRQFIRGFGIDREKTNKPVI